MAGMEFLKKEIGPLPAGAWAGVIGAALVFSYWRKKNTETVVPSPEAIGPMFTDDTVGNLGGLISMLNSGSNGPQMQTIQDNTSWYQQASRTLLGRGNNPSLVDSALRKYMQGMSLNAAEQAVIELALQMIGPLPSPPPPPVTTPGPEEPAPPPPPSPAPVDPFAWSDLSKFDVRQFNTGDYGNWQRQTAHLSNADLLKNVRVTYHTAMDPNSPMKGFAEWVGATTGISRPFPWLNEVARRWQSGTLTEADLYGKMIDDPWDGSPTYVPEFGWNKGVIESWIRNVGQGVRH
jgi:hypothetical protein